MTRPLAVLALDDNRDDAELMRIYLSRSFDLHWHHAETMLDFIDQLGDHIDIVLADNKLAQPNYQAVDAIAHVRQHFPQIPVIVVSGHLTPATSAVVLQAGATHFVSKSALTRLPAAVLAARAALRLAQASEPLLGIPPRERQ